MSGEATTAPVAEVGTMAPAATGLALFRRRARTWAGILSAYFSTQTLTQLLGIAAGLLFIRTMPVHEFALYTLATSVIAFFAFVTDLGSTTSLVHFYRRAAADGGDFARYVAAVLSLRRVAFLVGALVVAAALPLAASAKGYGKVEVALTTAAVIVAVGCQIAAAMRQLALRLHGGYGRSYRADVSGAALRLGLAVVMVVAALLQSWLAVLTAAAASALTAWMAGRATAPSGAGEAQAERLDLARYRRAVLRYLLPTLPSALYFAVQGPLVVWLAATFGGTRNIAEVGALTRLGLLVGLLSGLTGIVFMPRLARFHDERVFRSRVLQFGSLHLLLVATLLAAAWAAPRPFLLLLGPNYLGLHKELLLVVAGAGLSLLDGYLVAINLARSWTRWQGLALLSLVGAQAILVAVLPLDTSAGVLSFNLASAAAAFIGQAATLVIGFVRPQWVHWVASAGPEPAIPTP